MKYEPRRVARPATSPNSPLKRTLGIAMGAVIGLVVIAVGAVLSFQLYYASRVMPGVKLGGIDISGMRPEQVFDTAHAQSYYYRAQSLKLKISDSTFVYRPADFGAGLDPAETTKRAMSIGHDGDLQARLREQFNTYWNGKEIAPVTVQNDQLANTVLDKLLQRTQRQPTNARVEIENNAAREVPSQAGAKLDVTASYALLRGAIEANRTAELVLPLIAIKPDIPSAANAVAEASRMVGRDLSVMVPKWDDKGNPLPAVEAFRIRAADLPQFVTIQENNAAGKGSGNGNNDIQIQMRRERIRPLVEALAPAVTRTAQNARFKFDFNANKMTVITPSIEGRTLDVDKSLDAIEAAVRGDNRKAMIAISTTAPTIGDQATAESLGIKQLVIEATTQFAGSSQARRKNVAEAAKRFQGVIIPPGATFSFNDIVGDISKEEGFEEGLVIVGNRTVKGVGGGVCQVSTTVYQAALKAGLPIVERYNHGYRVSYYENTALGGLGPGYDATVFSPYADLKFVNDFQSHLLVETIYDAARVSLTFRFYGTKDGRVVTLSPASIIDEVPHGPPIYEPDTDGEVGQNQVKQTDFAVNGATIFFDRTVSRDNQVLIQERVRSSYQPWQSRFRYGPGYATFPADAVDGDGKPIGPPAEATPTPAPTQ